MVISGTTLRQAGDALQGVFRRCGRFINFKMRALACWKGISRYGSTLPAAMSFDDLIDVRIGIHVVQADPCANSPSAAARS